LQSKHIVFTSDRLAGDGWQNSVFSDDGVYFASSSFQEASVWNALNARRVFGVKHGGFIRTMTFSRDARYLVTGSYDHTAKILDLSTGFERSFFHPNNVMEAYLSPDDKYLVTVTEQDWVVRLWDLSADPSTATPLTSPSSTMIRKVVIGNDGKWLATAGDDGVVRVKELPTGKTLSELKVANDTIVELILSHDGRYMGAVAGGVARVYGVEGRNEVAQLSTGGGSIAFSHDGRYLISSGPYFASVWDIESGTEAARVGFGVNAKAIISSNGAYIAGADNREVRLMQWPNSEVLLRSSYGQTQHSVGVAHSGDRVAVSGDNGGVWGIDEGRRFAAFSGRNVDISGDGLRAASVELNPRYNGYSVAIYNIDNGQQLCRTPDNPAPPLTGAPAVAMSRDGKYFVTHSFTQKARIEVWRSDTCHLVHQIGQDIEGGLLTSSIAFNPDSGRFLTSLGGETYSHLYDTSTGHELMKFKSSSPVAAVSFSATGLISPRVATMAR